MSTTETHSNRMSSPQASRSDGYRSRRNLKVVAEETPGNAGSSLSGPAPGSNALNASTTSTVKVGGHTVSRLELVKPQLGEHAPRDEAEVTDGEGDGSAASWRSHTADVVLIPEVIPPEAPAVPDEDDEELQQFLGEASEYIREKHVSLMSSLRCTLRKASALGHELLAVRERLAHGGFEPWVKTNCPFSVRTARSYMQLARGEANLPWVSDPERQLPADLTLEHALKLIARPKPESKPRALKTPRASSERPSEPTRSCTDDATVSDDEEPAASWEHDAPPERPDQPEPASSPADSDFDADPDESSVADADHAAENSAEFPAPMEEEDEDELSDDEWLARLPAKRRLRNSGLFDLDALLWRRMQPLLQPLLQALASDREELRRAADPATAARWYQSRLLFLAGVVHPREWTACGVCRGRGLARRTREICPRCAGSGHAIRHVATMLDETDAAGASC